jgi:hypothetical protein
MEKPKVKIKNDKPELMIVNKCPLIDIVKNNNIYNFIINTVPIINKIVTQIGQFLNLFLIDKYDNNNKFPYIDENFIKTIIKIITKRQDTRGKPPSENTKELMKELKTFYDNKYKICINDNDIQDDTKLNFIMAYEVIDIITGIENNIKEHFLDYINKFVNHSFKLKDKINEINKIKEIDTKTKKELKTKIYSEFRLVKKDLVKNNNIYESDKKYHNWLNTHRPNIIKKSKFFKDSIDYDLCSNTQEYLKPLFYINKELEKINEENKIKNIQQIRLFQIIPQRTNIIPKYITIDTCALVNFAIKEHIIEYLSNIEFYKQQLWKNNFKTNKKQFKRKNYIFNGMIKTDGIGCSILLTKMKDGKPLKITSNMQKNVKKQLESFDKYIEDVEITNEMKKKRLVVIDPNMDDIIYCLSKTTPYKTIITDKNKKIIKEHNQSENLKFRYTQNQRRLETRNKKYNKLTDKINKETIIKNKSVKTIESELSIYSSRTVDYNKFIDYCKKKNEINRILYEHYSNKLFRKLKFNRYINTQKSESKMIKNFQKKYGKPENCLIVYGDYDKKEHMKGKEPIISKRMKKIFRKNKYDLYLINEFRTSKLCNKCCSECVNFLERESHKPKDINKETKRGKTILVWGLVRCTNVNCNIIHNRDKNSTLNMYKISKAIINGNPRPKEYCRSS